MLHSLTNSKEPSTLKTEGILFFLIGNQMSWDVCDQKCPPDKTWPSGKRNFKKFDASCSNFLSLKGESCRPWILLSNDTKNMLNSWGGEKLCSKNAESLTPSSREMPLAISTFLTYSWSLSGQLPDKIQFEGRKTVWIFYGKKWVLMSASWEPFRAKKRLLVSLLSFITHLQGREREGRENSVSPLLQFVLFTDRSEKK